MLFLGFISDNNTEMSQNLNPGSLRSTQIRWALMERDQHSWIWVQAVPTIVVLLFLNQAFQVLICKCQTQHLLHHKTDIIFAAFGFNESFAGIEKIPEFKSRLKKYITQTRTRAYNGEKGPKIILISPTPNQNLDNVPAADLNNQRLSLFTSSKIF